MNKSVFKLSQGFEEKLPKLEKARKQLKKEYAGIDTAIDQIIENVRSWYTLAEIQPKPNVINLWGLTGVGKTSLIQRLSELLDVKDRTFRIDLGEKQGKYALKSSLREIAEVAQDEPMIIILDEIQHARTIKSNGLAREEIDEDTNRMIWELIDSGKIAMNAWSGGKMFLFEYYRLLVVLIGAGVRISNGKVTKGVNLYKREMEEKVTLDDEQKVEDHPLAIPTHMYDTLMEHIPERLNIPFYENLEEYLKTLDTNETLTFLEEVKQAAKQPKVEFFNQALIFVVGNLDEAYEFGGNQTADISADEFYKQSLEINIPKIKSALKMRFRDEQIARLGNTHVIYPSLSQKAYRKLIELELKKYFSRLEDDYGVKWEFDASLIDKIYVEGVYPTQGARPVFTTIDQLVKSKTAVIFQYIVQQRDEIDTVSIKVKRDIMIIAYRKGAINKYKENHKLLSSLDFLRQPKRDESEAITAVHEAGHAVLVAHLLEQAPQIVTAVTTDSAIEGFVLSRPKYKYFPKRELIMHAAVRLGGLMAEKLIFGDEHTTMGSFSDIRQMHEMIDVAFKNGGMGKKAYYYSNHGEEDRMGIHRVEEVEKEMMSVMDQAKDLAVETLQKEKSMLLQLAKYLQEYAKVEEKEFVELYDRFGAKKVDFTKELSFYRNAISEELEKVAQIESIARHRSIVLNKNSSSKTVLEQSSNKNKS
jgi:cell division protease FtsH